MMQTTRLLRWRCGCD